MKKMYLLLAVGNLTAAPVLAQVGTRPIACDPELLTAYPSKCLEALRVDHREAYEYLIRVQEDHAKLLEDHNRERAGKHDADSFEDTILFHNNDSSINSGTVKDALAFEASPFSGPARTPCAKFESDLYNLDDAFPDHVKACDAEVKQRHPIALRWLRKQPTIFLSIFDPRANSIHGEQLRKALQAERKELAGRAPSVDSVENSDSATHAPDSPRHTRSGGGSAIETVKGFAGNIFTVALAGMVLLLVWSMGRKAIKAAVVRTYQNGPLKKR